MRLQLREGIYLRFRSGQTVFKLRRLLSHTKARESILTELLHTDDCTLLAHTNHELQLAVHECLYATASIVLAINLGKIEVILQKSANKIYSSPMILLNAYLDKLLNIYRKQSIKRRIFLKGS